MKKYKIWMIIEEIDESEDHYVDLDETQVSAGEYATQKEAQDAMDTIHYTFHTLEPEYIEEDDNIPPNLK